MAQQRRKQNVSGHIAAMLDGTEWTVDLLDEIAEVLRTAGYQVRDMADVDDEGNDE